MKNLVALLINSVLSIFLVVSLCSCANQYHSQNIGEGVVEKSIKIKKEDIAEAIGRDSTKQGWSGAKTGAITGAGLGLLTGPFAIIVSPILATAGGITGSLVGSVKGSIHGYTESKDKYLYSYAVKNKKYNKIYIVHQYDKYRIPDGSLVDIFIDVSNIYFIRKVSDK
ncbi:hypothetical protein [Dongshaea marina]|uniref:hypothetical protein n=1 Tax=Dongshaea marina TaxID=2047966 RepID=UPI000D3E3126|nr:hypothetical protein [Dongshaea marina]